MAAPGTAAAQNAARFDTRRAAGFVRRATLVFAVVAGAWFFLKFGTRWVPAGMDTVPTIPPGSYCVVDRWASGLRIGSDVFVDTPHGELLSRVVELQPDAVVVRHPNADSGWPDSSSFGPVPLTKVRATVVVVMAP